MTNRIDNLFTPFIYVKTMYCDQYNYRKNRYFILEWNYTLFCNCFKESHLKSETGQIKKRNFRLYIFIDAGIKFINILLIETL